MVSIFRILLVLASAASASLAFAQDVTTWHYDNSRSGVQPHETVLTPGNVTAAKFGKVFSFPVIGDIYAQPLYLSQYLMGDGKLHNVLLVATAQDYLYAFDADGKNPSSGYLWRRFLAGSGETWLTYVDVGKDFDINPNIGIISTPAVDRSGGTIYALARSKTTSGTTKYFQRLHALSIATGAEKANSPGTIQATVSGLGDGGTTITFDPLLHNQRAALLLAPTPGVGSGSSVFIAWASHGDHGTYHGWVMAYDAANVSKQNGAWVDTPNGREGGIWMAGGGPSSDNNGNVFIAAGNGTFDANKGGKDYGSSAFRITVGSSGLVLDDYFTPADFSSLNANDQDMGTGAVALLPTQSGSRPHLAVTVDKTGTIYLMNRDHLGDFTTPGNACLQSFSGGPYKNRSSFAFFNNTMYGGFAGAPLQAWSFNSSTELFDTTPQSKSANIFGCNCNGAGSTPSVSANGSSNGIVWALDNSGFTHTPAILHAYDASDLAKELYNSTQAANSRDAAAVAVKFTTPTIVNGHVYVGGRNAVSVYGLMNAPLVAAAPTFSPPAGTYSTSQTVAISDSTPNPSIYYTTNGSPASTGSTLYAGPIQVTSSETISAVAIAPGFSQSPEGVASYTIGSGTTCSAPTSPGVHVCKPVSGSTVASPVAVQAHATITGTLARMEVWVDGVKKYTETTSTSLSTSITLAAGAHTFHVYAVNTAGTKWLTAVNATVQ
jgi:Chitobiase/beta-hexosaminidase C-terminal domain/Bacterial Ig domain